MCMCEQMILAIFIIAVTLGTIPKFKVWIIQFSPLTDGAHMPCAVRIHLNRMLCLADLLLKLSLPLDL